MNPSILLIREDAEQWTGSDCCGKLEGENAHPEKERERIMGEMGCLFMNLQEWCRPDSGDTKSDVLLIDPRNQPFLFPKILRDIFRYHPPFREALRTLFMVYSLPAVILNGKVLFSGKVPDPSQVIRKIQNELRIG